MRKNRINVRYLGPADTVVGVAKTRQRPEGYTFHKGELTDVPADLWPLLEQIAAFEVVPDPAPLPSVPDEVEPTVEEKITNGT